MSLPPDPWREALGRFGRLLQDLRKKTRLTQEDLGNRIGYSGRKVSDLERGIGERVPSERLVIPYIDQCIAVWNIDKVIKNEHRQVLLREYAALEILRDRLRLSPRGTGSAIDVPALPAEAEWLTDDRMVRPLSAPPPRSRPICEVRFPVLVRRMAIWSAIALMGLLGTVLLVPATLSPTLLGPVAVLSVFVGCYLLVASLLFRVLTRAFLVVERKASTQTGLEYVLRGAVLALLMVAVGYVGIRYAAAGLPAPWHDYLPLVIAGVVAWWAAGAGMRGYRIDRAARSAGVPGVVAGWRRDGKPEAFVWRRAAQGLYDRLTGSPEWRRPRSPARQDQVTKEYEALSDAHATLLRQAARPLRQWLAEDHARAAVLGTVWAVGTVGLVLIVVVELVLAGHPLPRMVGVAVGAIVLVCGMAIAGVRLGHGSMRHRDTQLAAELAETLATLQPLIQDQHTD
ncbi:helix-turn-helix domain-containing protein [Actinocrispum wychmicini]|nr:helix-turn-helix transcriptional regulator [Actinocrispum wychmicini]